MDYSLPGSSVHGVLQARVLEWVPISFSRGSSRPRDRTQVSHIAPSPGGARGLLGQGRCPQTGRVCPGAATPQTRRVSRQPRVHPAGRGTTEVRAPGWTPGAAPRGQASQPGCFQKLDRSRPALTTTAQGPQPQGTDEWMPGLLLPEGRRARFRPRDAGPAPT